MWSPASKSHVNKKSEQRKKREEAPWCPLVAPQRGEELKSRRRAEARKRISMLEGSNLSLASLPRSRQENVNRKTLSKNKRSLLTYWVTSEIGEMKFITCDHLESGAASPADSPAAYGDCGED